MIKNECLTLKNAYYIILFEISLHVVPSRYRKNTIICVREFNLSLSKIVIKCNMV